MGNMKDVIFWNKYDEASKTFVAQLQSSGLLNYAPFFAFHVSHPDEQDDRVNMLLNVLEIRTLPTIYYQGNAFVGKRAFEWLSYHVSQLRPNVGPTAKDPPPPQHHREREDDGPSGLIAADEAGGTDYSHFDPDAVHSSDFGEQPFLVDTKYNQGKETISSDRLQQIMDERSAQTPHIQRR